MKHLITTLFISIILFSCESDDTEVLEERTLTLTFQCNDCDITYNDLEGVKNLTSIVAPYNLSFPVTNNFDLQLYMFNKSAYTTLGFSYYLDSVHVDTHLLINQFRDAEIDTTFTVSW